MATQPRHASDEAWNNAPYIIYNNTLPEALPNQRPHAEYEAHKEATEKTQKPTRLNRRTIWIIVIVALAIVIGAVVGGVVGGVESKSHKSSSNSGSGSNSTYQSHNSSQVLWDSKIAATNWTDAEGYDYHAAFWQGSSGHLFVSLWTAYTNNWTAINISAHASLSPVLGTPLAASARGYPWIAEPYNLGSFQVVLFYLSPSNTIESVYSGDYNLTSWQTPSSSGSITVTAGSKLAAFWDLCGTGCDGVLRVVYEDQNQALIAANSSDGELSSTTTWVKLIQHGSGIGLASVEEINNNVKSWTAPRIPKIYYTISSTVQEAVGNGPLSGVLTIGMSYPGTSILSICPNSVLINMSPPI
jgi:hypothetical protein